MKMINKIGSTCLLMVLVGFCFCHGVKAQTSSVVIPSNSSTGSLEKNMLFYAPNRFQVTHQGPAINLNALFDGRFQPVQTTTAPTPSNPVDILIEELPNYHTQQGAWVGWSTRSWIPVDFRIEAYDVYQGSNQWVTIDDVTGHNQRHYMKKMPSGSFSKIRFIFRASSGTGGLLQLSQLFYIHPEAVQAYEGLLVKYNNSGNVGIGTTTPQERLSVNGNIRAKEVKVEMANWPDYVFNEEYKLMPLSELETHIKTHGHLPGIPSAKEVEADGVGLAEMNRKLLEKVEELTLHLIDKEKSERLMQDKLEAAIHDLQKLKNIINKLKLNDQ